jgi:ribosomal protein S18 acetylase RimI-like enzyme
MKITVRPATINDIELLNLIHKRDGRKHARRFSDYPLAEWIMDQNNPFLIAFSSNTPSGFIRVRIKGDESKIDHFSVVKAQQFKGVEEALLREVETRIPHGTVEVHMPKSLVKLRKFYADQGYVMADEVHSLYGKSRHGVILRKRLDVPLFRKAPRIGKKERAKKPKKRVSKKRAVKGQIKNNKVLEENLKRLEEAFGKIDEEQ